MAQPQSTSSRRRVSLPKQLANFTNRTGGLDLTLRLVQALSAIAAVVCIDNVMAMRFSVATTQLALGRRYLRLFGFIDCFGRAYDLGVGNSPRRGAMLTSMELVKSSFLGFYLLLENLTILHDMDVWEAPWYLPVLTQANKLWFYAICISITMAVGELLFGSATKGKTQKRHSNNDRKKKSPSKQGSSTTSLLINIIADGCDLILPASFLGWTALGDLGVGVAMAVSTLIASRDVWAGAQL